MGSFTELTLAFTFSPDTPPEVLGAFSEWRTGEGAPDLPTLQEVLGDDPFDGDIHMGNFAGDDVMAPLSPVQRAAVWHWLLSWPSNAYFPGTPATALRWNRYAEHWTLTTRTLPKDSGASVQELIAPLGEWAADGTPVRPQFIGHILDETAARPVLIWSVGLEPFRFEGHFEEP